MGSDNVVTDVLDLVLISLGFFTDSRNCRSIYRSFTFLDKVDHKTAPFQEDFEKQFHFLTFF